MTHFRAEPVGVVAKLSESALAIPLAARKFTGKSRHWEKMAAMYSSSRRLRKYFWNASFKALFALSILIEPGSAGANAQPLPVDRSGEAIQLQLPALLVRKIESGEFIKSKTAPNLLRQWLQASQPKNVRLTALMFLDLQHSESPSLVSQILKDGSETEISYLIRRLLAIKPELAVTTLLANYDSQTPPSRKLAFLKPFGENQNQQVLPLIINAYVELANSINFSHRIGQRDKYQVLHEFSLLLIDYPTDKLYENLFSALYGDFNHKILALKVLYNAQHPEAIKLVRQWLLKAESVELDVLLNEVLFFDRALERSEHSFEPVADREIHAWLLKWFSEDSTGQRLKIFPRTFYTSALFEKHPELTDLLKPYLSTERLSGSVAKTYLDLYLAHSRLADIDRSIVKSAPTEMLMVFISNRSREFESLKPILLELASQSDPKLVAYAVKRLANTPEGLSLAHKMLSDVRPEVRKLAWEIVSVREPESLHERAIQALKNERNVEVRAGLYRELLLTASDPYRNEMVIESLKRESDDFLVKYLISIFKEPEYDHPIEGVEKLSPLLKRSMALRRTVLKLFHEYSTLPRAEDLSILIDPFSKHFVGREDSFRYHSRRNDINWIYLDRQQMNNGSRSILFQIFDSIAKTAPTMDEYGPILEPLLKSQDKMIQRGALGAWAHLRFLNRESWESPMRLILQQPDLDHNTRDTIQRVLQERRHPSQDAVDRQQSESAFSKYGVASLSALREPAFLKSQLLHPSPEIRSGTVELLKKEGDHTWVALLADLLSEGHTDLSLSVMEVLGQIGSKQDSDRVLPWLGSQDIQLKTMAWKTYFQLHGSFSPQQALALLDSPDQDLRNASFKALADTAPKSLYPFLQREFRSMSATRRSDAIRNASYWLHASDLVPDMVTAFDDGLVRNYLSGCILMAEREYALAALMTVADEQNFTEMFDLIAEADDVSYGVTEKITLDKLILKVYPESLLASLPQMNVQQQARILDALSAYLDLNLCDFSGRLS